VALGTLFEFPLATFGKVEDDSTEPTTAALQDLDLETSSSGTAVAAAEAPTAAPLQRAAGPTCLACSIGVGGAPGFVSAEEQRRHFSLDWHRYNVKRRAVGREPVSEAEFAALLEDEQQEVGSISGSESEQSDSDEDAEADAGTTAAGPQFGFTGPGALLVALVLPGHSAAFWQPLFGPSSRPERFLLTGLAPPSRLLRRWPAVCMLALPRGSRPRPRCRPAAHARPMSRNASHAAPAWRALGGRHAARRPLCGGCVWAGARAAGRFAASGQV
jgi:hypothetical protein